MMTKIAVRYCTVLELHRVEVKLQVCRLHEVTRQLSYVSSTQ